MTPAAALTVPGAGLLPMREAPDATFAAVDAFLTDTDPGSRPC